MVSVGCSYSFNWEKQKQNKMFHRAIKKMGVIFRGSLPEGVKIKPAA